MNPGLTRRQREVCELICRGLSNKEVARELRISPRTVEDYRSIIMKKYRARNMIEVALIWHNIVEPA